MNARNVQAVLAAGVHSPNLLAKWQQDPAFLRSKGIEPHTIDLAALRKFAGLSVKVKHNGLRFDFPLTFRLMGLAELDIPVFADYATHCAETGHRLAKTSAQRARDLISFLERCLLSSKAKTKSSLEQLVSNSQKQRKLSLDSQRLLGLLTS